MWHHSDAFKYLFYEVYFLTMINLSLICVLSRLFISTIYYVICFSMNKKYIFAE